MEFGDRVKKILRERELTQYELSEMVGYTHQSINRILSGRLGMPAMKVVNKISAALGVSAEYLLKGVDRPLHGSDTLVPVLSPDQVNLWLESPDSLQSESCEWVQCPISGLDSKTFAARMISDDMLDMTGHRSIPPGSLVFIDVNADAQPGTVVATIINNCFVIREKQIIAGQASLSPLNHKYSTIPFSDCKYVGRVVASLNTL